MVREGDITLTSRDVRVGEERKLVAFLYDVEGACRFL